MYKEGDKIRVTLKDNLIVGTTGVIQSSELISGRYVKVRLDDDKWYSENYTYDLFLTTEIERL